MRKSKGKKATLFAGVSIAAVLIVGLALWPEMVYHHYVHRLRDEPRFLLEVLDEDDSSLKGKALLAFLETDTGRRAILGAYLDATGGDEVFRPERQRAEKGLLCVGESHYSFLLLRLPLDSEWHWCHLEFGRQHSEASHPLLLRLQSRLKSLEDKTVTLPEYPSFEFSVVRDKKAYETVGYPPSSWDPAPTGYSCVLRRVCSTIPEILGDLRDGEEPVRLAAVVDLFVLGHAASPALSGLGQALEDESLSIQRAAAATMRKLGAPAVEHFVRRLHHEVPSTRLAVISSLGAMGAASRAALPSLEDLLSDRHEDVSIRLAVISSFGAMGEAARAALPSLENVLNDHDWRIRLAAAELLVSLDHGIDKAIPVLVYLIRSRELREKAAIAAVEYAQLLRSVSYRYRPALALAKAGSAGTPVLAELLDDADPFVRGMAAWALAEIPQIDAEIESTLSERLRDRSEEYYVRLYAAHALGAPGASAQAARVLTEALYDEDFRIQCESVRSLGRLGMTAFAALPTLRRLAKCPSEKMRELAADAVVKIGGPSTAQE